MSYKYCIVPECKSTTRNTPDKHFFYVPMDPKTRKMWFNVMKRDSLSSKSTHYCCEDHFDVEADVENYIRFKLMGGKLRLKQGVVPHRFSWRKPPEPVKPSAAIEKRNRIEFLENLLTKSVEERYGYFDKDKPIEFVSCANPNDESTTPLRDPLQDPDSENPAKKRKLALKKNKSVQVNLKPKMCDQSSQTKRIRKKVMTDKICQTKRIRTDRHSKVVDCSLD